MVSLLVCLAMTLGKLSMVRFVEWSPVGSEQRMELINWVHITNALTALHQCLQGGTGLGDASLEFFVRRVSACLLNNRYISPTEGFTKDLNVPNGPAPDSRE